MRLDMLACGLLLSLGTSAGAQEPSTSDIRDALTPRLLDRTIVVEPKRPGAPTGGQPTGRPSISLKVPFEYDSAAIAPEATSILQKLAAALRDPALAGFRFEIGGHTDAKGDAGYNLALSERRAAAVRTFLVKVHGIAADKLAARGYGKARLADPAHPDDAVNRRVEIVNLGAAAAGK